MNVYWCPTPIQYPHADTWSFSATNCYVLVRQLSEQITRFALNETLTPQVWPSRRFLRVNSGQILTDRRDEFNLIPAAIWWARRTLTYKTVITFFRSGRRFKWNPGTLLSRATWALDYGIQIHWWRPGQNTSCCCLKTDSSLWCLHLKRSTRSTEWLYS